MNHTSTADVVAVFVRKNKCLAVSNVIPKLGKTRLGLDSADTRVKEYARIVAAYEYAVAAASRLQGDDFHDVSVSIATIPWKQSRSIVGTVANWSLMTRTAPENLVALWMLATLDGIGSIRELDRRYSSDFVYLWICGGVGITDHTLSDFRSQQAEFL